MALGPFARTCQAAHMLGAVLTHIDSARRAAGGYRERLLEALRFHEAFAVMDKSLAPFISGAQRPGLEGYAYYPAMAICCSARLLLSHQHGCNEPDADAEEERVVLQTQVHTPSIRAIESMASTTVPVMARDVARCVASSDVRPSVSPLLAHCMYSSATSCAWLIREDHERAMYVALHHAVSGLSAMQAEWALACRSTLLLAAFDPFY